MLGQVPECPEWPIRRCDLKPTAQPPEVLLAACVRQGPTVDRKARHRVALATLEAEPLDISRARDVLEWEPAYSLEEAFADYVEEFRRAVTA